MQKILIVDDAELNREMLREILKDDYLVEVAENGKFALQKLEECRDEVAALLLDIHLDCYNSKNHHDHHFHCHHHNLTKPSCFFQLIHRLLDQKFQYP